MFYRIQLIKFPFNNIFLRIYPDIVNGFPTFQSIFLNSGKFCVKQIAFCFFYCKENALRFHTKLCVYDVSIFQLTTVEVVIEP